MAIDVAAGSSGSVLLLVVLLVELVVVVLVIVCSCGLTSEAFCLCCGIGFLCITQINDWEVNVNMCWSMILEDKGLTKAVLEEKLRWVHKNKNEEEGE